MEKNNKASTSRFKSDSSDEEDEHHENFSTEELDRKKNTFLNICLGNKINVNNASSKSTTRIKDDNNSKVSTPKTQNLMLTTHEKLTRTPSEDEKCNIDESTQQNIKQTKTFKNQDQVKKDNVKIDWLDMKQIDGVLKKNDRNRKYTLPHTPRKWNSLPNIFNTPDIVPDIKYKFNFLKYAEIEPDWRTSHKNCEGDGGSETSNSYQSSNDYSRTTVDTLEAMEIEYKVSEKLENKNHEKIDEKLADLNISGELNPEDENCIADITTETEIDMIELKKRISDIIDEQCVETNTNSEWSSKLSFFNLLTLLPVNERDGISIPKVFVGLILLANERELRLFQEHCVINDMEETFIVKPMNKE